MISLLCAEAIIKKRIKSVVFTGYRLDSLLIYVLSLISLPSSASLLPLLPVDGLRLSTVIPVCCRFRYPAAVHGFPGNYLAYPERLPVEYRIRWTGRSATPTIRQSWFPGREHRLVYRYPTSCIPKGNHVHSSSYLRKPVRMTVSAIC